MVIAYAPPVDAPNGGQETLYILPADGSRIAERLFIPADSQDQNAQVVWSPDGKYLYFAHLNYQKPEPVQIWRVAYPGGKPQNLLANAYWPRLSSNSTRLTYVSQDKQTGINSLFVAAADGTQPRQVPLSGPYIPAVIDVPMFSPDGQTILFSAPDSAAILHSERAGYALDDRSRASFRRFNSVRLVVRAGFRRRSKAAHPCRLPLSLWKLRTR